MSMNVLKINGAPIPGIFVDAAISFNKPAKRVQSIHVPGRNGNLIVDEGTFDNVLITYPVFEKSTFPMEFDSIVNWLASLEGYQRIECSNDPTHFRLGRFVVPEAPTAKRLNRDGYYQLSFDCKPQRYLNLGEVPTEIDANPSETYGPADIVSFEAAEADTISGAEFGIEPVQDLHGYDAPWPAGGGKNLWSADATFSKDNTKTYITKDCNLAAGTYTLSGIVTAEEGVTSTRFSFRSTSPVTAQLPVGSSRTSVTFELTEPCTQVYVYGQNGTSGTSAATYTDIMVEAGSTATSYAPYANECPISGWTGAEITAKGVNLWDEEWELGNIDPSTGSTIVSTTNIRSKNYIPILPNTSYYFYFGTYYNRAFYYDADKNYISYEQFASGVKTTPSNCCYMKIRIDSSYGTTYNNDISINYPSTDTAYHASVGATKDISWTDEAGTVYGGTLEYLGGDAWRLTSYNKKLIMDDDNWALSSATKTFYKQLSDNNLAQKDYTATFEGISDAFKPYQLGDDYSTGNYVGYYVSGTVGIRFSFPSLNGDINAFATYIDGKEVIYPLATPVVYDLTGEELVALVGKNNVFANCGQSTVVITEPTYFVNPGFFTSKPIIRVYGDGMFRVGDNIITIAAHTQPYIDIDSELQDCYYEDTNMNAYVTFASGDYPELIPGSTYVLMGDGITKLIITPRWWEL